MNLGIHREPISNHPALLAEQFSEAALLCALNGFRDGLAELRARSSPKEWRAFCAQTPLEISPKSQTTCRWEFSLGFWKSLRSRRATLARELSELRKAESYPRILAVSAGRLRALPSNRQFGKFQLIYAPAVLDTLEALPARHLITRLAHMLESGGRLLMANFSPDVPAAAYMEACLGWWPVYRNEQELAGLASGVPASAISGQTVFRDDSGGSLFLELQAV